MRFIPMNNSESNLQPGEEPPIPKTSSTSSELRRLLAAAVINQEFCDLLLDNPQIAIVTGYQGEAFYLETEVIQWITSIRATNLVDFALQLTDWEDDTQESKQTPSAWKRIAESSRSYPDLPHR
jgi:hypothetical protein